MFIKTSLASFIVSLSATFLTATGFAESRKDISMSDRYDTAQSFSLVTDARAQCAVGGDTSYISDMNVKKRADSIFSALRTTDETRVLSESFSRNNGVLCFVDMKKERSGLSVKALYSPDDNVILLNNSSHISEGCQVSFALHELRHAQQKSQGVPIVAKELSFEEQRRLAFTLEADAHAVQLVESKQLELSGYPDAHTCNQRLANNPVNKHIAFGMNILSESIKDGQENLSNGQALADVNSAFIHNFHFFRIYTFRTSGLYDSESVGAHALNGQSTLGDIGVDLNRWSESSSLQYKPIVFTPDIKRIVRQKLDVHNQVPLKQISGLEP